MKARLHVRFKCHFDLVSLFSPTTLENRLEEDYLAVNIAVHCEGGLCGLPVDGDVEPRDA